MATFQELLKASFKSEDTEEWLDVHFTRPIGLAFALFWNRFNVHPNVITILSIFLGMAAGYMFYFTDLAHNLWGVVLLTLANFCDSTDGQMARLTGKKTLVGRVLDGFAGDVWFFCIYLALVFRLWNQDIPGLDGMQWGIWGFFLACCAGFLAHSPQASLADYYRQIHLFFLLGKSGSELDNSRQQRQIYDSLAPKQWFARLFYYNYSNYCRSQERRTPKFQQFFAKWNDHSQPAATAASPTAADTQADTADRQQVRREFLDGSRPLMKYTNLLTHNSRAITLFVTACLNCPWVYLLFEVVVLNILYAYMHRTHEKLCETLTAKL